MRESRLSERGFYTARRDSPEKAEYRHKDASCIERKRAPTQHPTPSCNAIKTRNDSVTINWQHPRPSFFRAHRAIYCERSITRQLIKPGTRLDRVFQLGVFKVCRSTPKLISPVNNECYKRHYMLLNNQLWLRRCPGDCVRRIFTRHSALMRRPAARYDGGRIHLSGTRWRCKPQLHA